MIKMQHVLCKETIQCLFFNKLSFLVSNSALIQGGEEQESFWVLRNGKVFKRLQQNWCTVDVREVVWLGKAVAVEDIVSYHTSPLEHPVAWEKQENLENAFADFQ